MYPRGEHNPLISCAHGNIAELCKECLVEGFAEKKTKTPIKSLKQRSEEQERRIAKGYKKVGFTHAQRVPMSGAIATMKADVDPGELLLVEAKETSQGSLVIDPEWILKVQKESFDKGRRGFAAVHAWVSKKDVHRYYKVVVVEESLWFEILEGYKNATTQH
jgi:Holliday junction resolvase